MSTADPVALRKSMPAMGALPPNPRDIWTRVKELFHGFPFGGNTPGSGAEPRRTDRLALQALCQIAEVAA